MDDREGKGFALSNLTLINYFTEQYAEAQQYAHEALQVHAEIEDSRSAAYTNTYLGHILLAVGEVDLAETAYQTGLDIRQASQSENSAVDNLAGLAQVAYQRGELTAALDLAEKAWSRIQDNGVDGVEYPLQVLRDCYRIFKNDEVRAETVLSIRNTAKTYLQNQAKVINDPELRQSFLTNVPFNQWWLSN
jgi:tetratricopeptide (TPR) repeat protein